MSAEGQRGKGVNASTVALNHKLWLHLKSQSNCFRFLGYEYAGVMMQLLAMATQAMSLLTAAAVKGLGECGSGNGSTARPAGSNQIYTL